jgi:hypothetical protein
VHTLFWASPTLPAATRTAELQEIIAALRAHGTRRLLDFSQSAPLPAPELTTTWQAFLAEAYARRAPLPCEHAAGACGWVYERR